MPEADDTRPDLVADPELAELAAGRHRDDPADDSPPQYPVVSDQPLQVKNPKATVRLIAVQFALAIVLRSGAAGWVGYQLAAAHTDKRIHALEDDLEQRRQARAKQDAQVHALLEQYRQAMCALIERTPPDAEIDRQRAIYHCGPYRPPVSPSPGQGATPGPPGTAGPQGPSGQPGAPGPPG